MEDNALAKNIKERYKAMQTEKSFWLESFQLIGEYVGTRKQDFTAVHSPGKFLTGSLNDSTAATAAHLLSSSLIGALWPNAYKAFRLVPYAGMKPELRNKKDIKEYFEEVTRRVARAFANPKAGFILALEEYMFDQGSFGTSGISALVNENEKEIEDTPVIFNAIDVKRSCIAEGADGFVDTIYIEREYTVRQVVQLFKLENVSSKLREMYTSGRLNDKVKILHATEPDEEGAAKPIRSIHMELETDHILKRRGFNSMPAMVTRFWKLVNEVYGRSPAWETMPNILEINAMREMTILAVEKFLDPPVLVTDDGSIGGDSIDLSAGGLVVRRVSGRVENYKPVEPIVTTVELTSTYKRLDELEEIIRNDFFVDRILDLNNEQRMTLGEANIRNQLREQSLGTIYARQLTEMFSPLIERVVQIMFENKLLGIFAEDAKPDDLDSDFLIIPDEIARRIKENKHFYDTMFTSPAARILRQEELTGITQTIEYAIQVQPIQPDVMDGINMDNVTLLVQELSGAPSQILRSSDEVAELRARREQANMAAMQAEQEAQISQANRNNAQAASAAKSAGIPLDG